MKAALAFVEVLTLRPDAVSADDLAATRAAGLSDHELRELGGVVFCFSVMDRLADAFDFMIPTDEQAAVTGDFLYNKGYKLVKMLR